MTADSRRKVAKDNKCTILVFSAKKDQSCKELQQTHIDKTAAN